ncbi:MAG: helix-hairpin-helix domain-containing protein [Candidatus Nanopelagicales bacterium]|nr:helix-hairpin-helix domain-containing protein [Candidatus Nanopelagicales bacterium]
MNQPNEEFDWRRVGRSRWAVEPKAIGIIVAICVVAVLVAVLVVTRSAAGSTGAQPIVVSATGAPSDNLIGTGPTAGKVGASVSPGLGTQSAAAVGAGVPGESESQVVVHVVGPVRRPGLVRLPAGSRVGDAIAAAGGLTTASRPKPRAVNLARVVQDGEQVDASGRDQPGPAGAAQGGAVASAKGSDGLLDLNRATMADLEELPRVGPVTAQKIIDFRQQHGRFDSVEQLKEIAGIGDRTFEQLAPLVRV